MPATQNVTKLNVRRTATATITSKYRDAQALREQKRSSDKIIPVIHITINTVQDKTPKIKEKKSKSKAIDVPCAKNISSRHIQEKDKKPDRYEVSNIKFL
ncbi:hypothetical protein PUN28_018356 [Cardiocondyla obscurior]|uniref:Uncharacterized protein n=1 Tax=Cardiocondyla obscurior TaxID=286306 RepID=A0AAW2EKV3_9HYME